MLKKTLSVCALMLAVTLSGTALAGDHHRNGPGGFGFGSYHHQGITCVNDVHRYCGDDDYVLLRGSLTRYFGDDDYEFTDERGDTIAVELDDDENWSHISKDQLIEIYGEVERDDFRVKLEVKSARPVR